MKRLLILFAVMPFLWGCECPPEEKSPYPKSSKGESEQYVIPQGNNGFSNEQLNMLSFPIELSDESIDESGEFVWQYYYESSDSKDYRCRVDLVMHCNHTEDFDFINYPMFFSAQRWDFDTIVFLCERFPDLSTANYYCMYQPCVKHNENYGYEMVFPIVFATEGSYSFQISIQSFDHTQGIPVTLYNYRTKRIYIEVCEDTNDAEWGGKVIMTVKD